MERKRIANAVSIINYAISNKTSIKKACVLCGFSDTYVKNVKRELTFEETNGMVSSPELEAFKIALAYYGENRQNEDVNLNQFKSPRTFAKLLADDIVPLQPMADPFSAAPPPPTGEKESFRQKGNEAEYEWIGGSNYPKDHIRTLDQLLKAAQVDQDIWRVKDHIVNKWDVTSWKNGNPVTKQNFQVKARLERIEEFFKYKKAAEIFIDMINGYQPPVLSVEPRDLTGIVEKNLLEISIFDLHIGKLAWGGETGENYDVKIASRRFLNAIETLLRHASGFQYSKILFPIGNDFYNSDTIFNTTTKGTQQDEDLRWQKTFKVGARLIVDGINLLKQTGVPVDVVVIPGNHDFERSFYLGEYLDAWFNNDPIVHVNNGASPRKYYRFGKVLLGLTHGSEEKESSLPLLMATDIESKPHWSETLYHEWHLGHIHRKRNVRYSVTDNKERTLNEDLGVTVRYLSSLTGTEEWHHKKGFVGSVKAADGFVWNDEDGLIAQLNSNLVMNGEE